MKKCSYIECDRLVVQSKYCKKHWKILKRKLVKAKKEARKQ